MQNTRNPRHRRTPASHFLRGRRPHAHGAAAATATGPPQYEPSLLPRARRQPPVAARAPAHPPLLPPSLSAPAPFSQPPRGGGFAARLQRRRRAGTALHDLLTDLQLSWSRRRALGGVGTDRWQGCRSQSAAAGQMRARAACPHLFRASRLLCVVPDNSLSVLHSTIEKAGWRTVPCDLGRNAALLCALDAAHRARAGRGR